MSDALRGEHVDDVDDDEDGEDEDRKAIGGRWGASQRTQRVHLHSSQGQSDAATQDHEKEEEEEHEDEEDTDTKSTTADARSEENADGEEEVEVSLSLRHISHVMAHASAQYIPRDINSDSALGAASNGTITPQTPRNTPSGEGNTTPSCEPHSASEIAGRRVQRNTNLAMGNTRSHQIGTVVGDYSAPFMSAAVPMGGGVANSMSIYPYLPAVYYQQQQHFYHAQDALAAQASRDRQSGWQDRYTIFATGNEMSASATAPLEAMPMPVGTVAPHPYLIAYADARSVPQAASHGPASSSMQAPVHTMPQQYVVPHAHSQFPPMWPAHVPFVSPHLSPTEIMYAAPAPPFEVPPHWHVPMSAQRAPPPFVQDQPSTTPRPPASNGKRKRNGSGGRPPSSGLEKHPSFPSMVHRSMKQLWREAKHERGVRDEDVRRFVAEKWDIYDNAMKYIDNAIESLCANEKLARTADGLLVLVVKKLGRPRKKPNG